jgi:hypothetical protein
MALHPLKLPRRSASLFRMVVLQKRLRKALADPALPPNSVNTAWLQSLWCSLDAEWVRKFCLGGQEGRMQKMAQATLIARQALYNEFCRQNNVPKLLKAGGDFRDLRALPDVDASLARTVTEFFKDCYDLLGQASRTRGYAFRRGQPNPSHYLSMRWTNAAATHFDVLVERVNRRVNAANSIEKLVRIQLADHQAERGRTASSMVHAAVCQAILDQRPEYLQEFATPNPPALA